MVPACHCTGFRVVGQVWVIEGFKMGLTVYLLLPTVYLSNGLIVY